MGLTVDKVLVILIIAMVLLGPQRIPEYTKKFGDFVRTVRRMANDAKGRLREEMGDEFDEVDWKKLDPRQYDPRRIIRDAMLEDDEAPSAQPAMREAETAGGATAATAASAGLAAGTVLTQTEAGSLNFDEEAT